MTKVLTGIPTEKQQEVLNLIESGSDINDIPGKLGVGLASIQARLRAARNVVERFHGEGSFSKKHPLAATYVTNDTGQRAAVYASHTPQREIEEEAAAVGIPPSKLRILKQRVNFVKKNIDAQPVLLTDDQLKDAVREKLSLVLGYIDNFSLATAKLSELSSSFKSLFEAKQLLDGRPTQILDKTSRMELDELVPRLMEEARRRGVMIKDVEGEVIEGTITPAKPKKLKDPPNQGSHFPNGATKAYFDRHGYRWPGAEDDAKRTKWKDIDERGY